MWSLCLSLPSHLDDTHWLVYSSMSSWCVSWRWAYIYSCVCDTSPLKETVIHVSISSFLKWQNNNEKLYCCYWRPRFNSLCLCRHVTRTIPMAAMIHIVETFSDLVSSMKSIMTRNIFYHDTFCRQFVYSGTYCSYTFCLDDCMPPQDDELSLITLDQWQIVPILWPSQPYTMMHQWTPCWGPQTWHPE